MINFGFIKDLNRDDWFSIYINAIASRFDPHTSYFAPNEKERFYVSMSGNFKICSFELLNMWGDKKAYSLAQGQ